MNKVINFSQNPEDKDLIKEMARIHFGRNPRLVKSFIRDLGFLFSVIKPRFEYLSSQKSLNSQEQQEKKNLEEILGNPALLGKIIVIREKFPKEFKSVQRDPTIISKIEENPNEEPNFGAEIKTLISSWPLFKNRDSNPANFIFLGGSSGTEFSEEIDAGQFINYANAGDIENFYQAISKSPPYKREEYLDSVINAHNSATDDVKTNIEKVILGAVFLVENLVVREKILNSVIGWAEANNGKIFNQLNSEQIKRWIRSLDKTKKEEDQLSKIISETPYGNTDPNIRNRFWEAFTLSNLSEAMIGKFSIFFSSLLNSFAEKQLLLDLLSRDEFLNRIGRNPERINVINNLINFCISQSYSDEKNKAINLIERLDPDDANKKQLIEHLISWLKSQDENQKNFAREHVLKIDIWPNELNTLRGIVRDFKNFYKTLDKNEQNTYQMLIKFFKEKEVWNGKRRSRTKVK